MTHKSKNVKSQLFQAIVNTHSIPQETLISHILIQYHSVSTKQNISGTLYSVMPEDPKGHLFSIFEEKPEGLEEHLSLPTSDGTHPVQGTTHLATKASSSAVGCNDWDDTFYAQAEKV